MRELAALREENASLQATHIDPADTLLVAIIDLVHCKHAAGFGATDVMMPGQFNLAADGQQRALCWVNDYENAAGHGGSVITMSFGDFQRLIPKLCAMGQLWSQWGHAVPLRARVE